MPSREADFSHMSMKTIDQYIHLKMKESLTEEEAQRIAEIEANIRYKTSNREPHIPQSPRGENESGEEYITLLIT